MRLIVLSLLASAPMGGLAGGFRRRDERLDQSNQRAAASGNAATSQGAAYNRVMAACLQGRGYTVSQELAQVVS